MKKLSKVFYVLSILSGVAGLLCGCIYGLDGKSFLLFLTYTISGAGGTILFLGGYYTLDTLSELNERSKKQGSALQKLEALFAEGQTAGATQEPSNLTDQEEAAPDRGDWQMECPYCGQVQRSNRTRCLSCGAYFAEKGKAD